MSLEPAELEEIALALEQKASTLRAMADEMRAPKFKLVPEETRPTRTAPVKDAAAGNLFAEVLGWFTEAWAFYNYRPYLVRPADRSQLGRLINAKTGMPKGEVPELKVWFARYMTDRDPFVVSNGHTLALFCSRVNTYRAAKPTDGRTYL